MNQKKNVKERFTIYLPTSISLLFRELCSKEKRPFSSMIEIVLEEYLEKKDTSKEDS